MRELSQAGQAAIIELSAKHGFSADAVLSMLHSVIAGNGGMAQFHHPEFGGSGQWMRGGMIMISDMFNSGMKSRIDDLCGDLATLVASQPDLVLSGSFQSQSQGAPSFQRGQQQSHGGSHSASSQGASLFVPSAAGPSGHWWGAELGAPAGTGAQNNVRYAWFPASRRLAIEVHGQVTIYDTLDHQIGGFSQQQSQGSSITFTSQHGAIELSSLPVVSGESAEGVSHQRNSTTQSAPPTHTSHLAPPPSMPEGAEIPPRPEAPRAATPEFAATSPGGVDIFAALEKLAELHGKGVLTDEEFAAKKTDLLGRI
jgi:hypothetical protein